MKNNLITRDALFVKSETGEMILAESAVERITEIETQMKALDKEYRKFKTVLKDGMEHYGLKSVDTDDVLITYVEPTEAISLDRDKLKEKYKKAYFDCQTLSERSGYVKVTVR